MKSVKLPESIAVKLTVMQRKAIEERASEKNISLGEATRDFIDMGIEVNRK
jgi:hypothetical protein